MQCPDRSPSPAPGFPPALIKGHQEVIDRLFFNVDFGQESVEFRAALQLFQIGLQLPLELFGVLEGVVLGVLLHKKVKGVDGGHVGYNFNIHFKLGAFFRKHQPCQIVTEGILLPVDEMLRRFNLQAVTVNGRARMGGRAQAHRVRRHVDWPVKLVGGAMVDCNANSHFFRYRFWPWRP